MDRALAVFAEMKADPCVAPDLVTFNTLISEAGKCRDLDAAFRFFEELKGAALTGGGAMRPDVVTYTALIAACAGSDEGSSLETAFEVFEEMKRVGGVAAPNVRTYAAMIAVCGKWARHPLALRLFQEMKGCRCQGGGS
jgi:pentatricopeptide repeat domain-containing protein 1